MVCEKCKKKPVARGIKLIHCTICGHTSFVNHFYGVIICQKCSDELQICQYGGCNEVKKNV